MTARIRHHGCHVKNVCQDPHSNADLQDPRPDYPQKDRKTLTQRGPQTKREHQSTRQIQTLGALIPENSPSAKAERRNFRSTRKLGSDDLLPPLLHERRCVPGIYHQVAGANDEVVVHIGVIGRDNNSVELAERFA